MRADRLLVLLAWTQGAYFAATAAWAILHVESFQLVTGPKTDVWLVRTVSVLILAVGGTLMLAAWRLRVGAEVAFLAIASALGIAAVEIAYVADGTIRPIYAVDAAIEVVLAGAWGAAAWRAGGQWWARNAQLTGRGRTP